MSSFFRCASRRDERAGIVERERLITTAYTTLKMAVVAPMPSATVSRAGSEYDGRRISERNAAIENRESPSAVLTHRSASHRIGAQRAARGDVAGHDGDEAEQVRQPRT